MDLGILRLPEATAVTAENKFIVYKNVNNNYITDYVTFTNLRFGLDNVSFATTISANESSLNYLNTTLYNLSAEESTQYNSISAYIVTFVNTMFNNLKYNTTPIGCIRYTATQINPSAFLPNTVWVQISGGLFVAGVGESTDTNSKTIEFIQGNVGLSSNNFLLGEYSHKLIVAELPPHTHTANQVQETNATVAGLYTESANTPIQYNIYALTSTSTGGSINHNNVPPFFGLYVWRRIA